MKSVFLFLLASVGSVCIAGAERPTNFIVVLCDNLGYGDIEPFGSQLHRTPNLKRMAGEGRKFTHFYVTAGVCTPSRASLMTGCYAQRIGMHSNPRDGWVLRPVSPYGLAPSETTIAEILKPQGYATAIIGKWHLGDQPKFLPTNQGFDSFFGIPYSDDMTARTWTDGSQWPPLPLMENDAVVEAPCDRNGLTKRYTERAIEWIREHHELPFFLYLPQAMPGSTRKPFASQEFRGKSRNGPWGDAVEELDWSMGQIMDELRDLGIAERTLVVWTSDNGAPINADGSLTRGSNLPLRGRGYSTSEGAFRVPAIAWQPKSVPANTVCDQLITTMDLLPTFAALSKTPVPKELPIDGKDVSRLIYGEPQAETPHQAFYYYQENQLQAVRSGNWKLFLPVLAKRHPHFGPTLKPQNLLFDLIADVSCENNVADQHPEVVDRLTKLAEQARYELGDWNVKGRGQRERGRISEGQKPIALTKPTAALQMIESNRGGRHWADAATDPPRSPQESLASLKIENGFALQLVASEPLVFDPVAITFDHQGNMYAVEYGDYPIGPEAGGEPLSRIVMLKDNDGDGRMDERVVYADKLDFAHSAMPFRDGLLVGAKSQILFIKDSDGDDVADIRQVWFDGFKPAHPQMQIGNPRWGIDNWIYFNYGPGNVTRTASFTTLQGDRLKAESKVLPRKEFRFDPQRGQFAAGSGLGQFGNTIDRWGNRFYCTNRNPIITSFLSPEQIERNPFHIIPRAYYDVAPSGGASKVYPLVKMKSNYLSHAGTHTSACGTTAYLGGLMEGDMRRSVFVCEPIGHLVTRSIITEDGPRLSAVRAQGNQDFIASDDTWFRPASLATGPDGSLYLADMYRLWVEHPKFLPPDVSAKLDWRAGEDRGRIYRVVPDGKQVEPYAPPKSDADVVSMLASENGWAQVTAQRLLMERGAVNQISEVRRLLGHEQSTTRLRALWTLQGLGGLESDDVLNGLKDDDFHVRQQAVRLATKFASLDVIHDRLSDFVSDDSALVRFEVAITAGALPPTVRLSLLSQLAKDDGADSTFVHAILSSARDCSGRILSSLMVNSKFVNATNSDKVRFVSQLASIVGARGEAQEVREVLKLLGSSHAPFWFAAAVLKGIGEGLPRYRGPLGKLSLQRLVSNPPEPLDGSHQLVSEILDKARQRILDSRIGSTERISAIELMRFSHEDGALAILEDLLDSVESKEVQAAAINVIAAVPSPASYQLVLRKWSQLNPSIRANALAFLLRRAVSTQMVLDSIERNEFSSSAFSVDQRVALLKHRDPGIRGRAESLLGGAISRNRTEVAVRYRAALNLPGDAMRGHKVFKRVCAGCHRIGDLGHNTGPDLSDTRNRSKEALLYDILDPNAKVEPRYSTYQVLTNDGSAYSGLLATETENAIVLSMADGKEQTLNRMDIQQLKVSDVSLMPEGIEKEVSVEQMADLLEFLKPQD